MSSGAVRILLLFTMLAKCHSLLYEGEHCTVPATGSDGKCVNIEKCEYARKLLKTKKDPKFCGFLGKIPRVCCPIAKLTIKAPGNISQSMCLKYHDPKRPLVLTIIEMGNKALPKEFPHMAAKGFGRNENSVTWACGGTLISPMFILTAAHCVNSRQFGPAKWVRLGDLDLEDTTEEANPTDLAITASYVHPNYTYSSRYNDIALLKLEQVPEDFGIFYNAACLHSEKEIGVQDLEAIGWDNQGLFGESSSHLLKVSLKPVAHKTCAELYANEPERKLKNGILDESQLCAGSKVGGDTCPGDSGGPLHYYEPNGSKLQEHNVVVGITSFGKGCGVENSIGVYTGVSSHLDWIENIVWAEHVNSEKL